ncbi:DUF3093 domain-containing protein [Actinomycetospora lutea]|uniref:DUF3093 domain-containing protein n=1 Tax=Actinomycetospora lutea TaxID=663604 RepID=UPI0023654B57|nr:DUF3093 domain-containing protein [Actinomycetospora lutea]MDD7936840.1 DUF3093 domain-containing protein [Actinomycetospora lutea]
MSTPRPSPGPDTTPRAPAYAERLVVPWWWWPPVLLMAGLLAAELHMGHPGVRAWLPYVLLLPLAVVLLVWLGRVRVDVDGRGAEGARELRAGPAHLPVSQIGRVDVVVGEAKREALGPQLDPEAFVLHRPWVGPAVRIEVIDPDDPTPYWVVSTRRPEELLAALREGLR